MIYTFDKVVSFVKRLAVAPKMEEFIRYMQSDAESTILTKQMGSINS